MSWILYRIGWSDISADERAKVLSKVEHIAALSPRTSPDQRITEFHFDDTIKLGRPMRDYLGLPSSCPLTASGSSTTSK